MTLTLEVLISTIDAGVERVGRVLLPPSPHVRYLVLHQQARAGEPASSVAAVEALALRDDVRVVASRGRGLSKSRNLCLRHAQGDVLLFADDDVRYEPGSFERVLAVFEDEPLLDVATFRIRTPDGTPYRTYGDAPKAHGRISVLSVSSIEIAARREALRRAAVTFDERFGLGTSYPASEEAIFLHDCVRAGLRVEYRPVEIVEHAVETSGVRWGDADLVASKGPLFLRMYGWKGVPLFFAFAVAKWPAYRAQRSLPSFVLSGVRAMGRFRRTPADRSL